MDLLETQVFDRNDFPMTQEIPPMTQEIPPMTQEVPPMTQEIYKPSQKSKSMRVGTLRIGDVNHPIFTGTTKIGRILSCNIVIADNVSVNNSKINYTYWRYMEKFDNITGVLFIWLSVVCYVL
ncbi:uncharacterized protein LOC105696842 [Orussus abietinus]|uniref:uncharacterized protein LOC105696842 n=1 Tax=Orussus abietinus TaxID=222816 RepID=UPI000625029D|nr:uncharacterized protein LOC105696842 [Orussus abietinus]